MVIKGVDIFRTEQFGLCVLDVMMPKKDGFTAAAEIKRMNPDIPVIFLTAKTQQQDKIEGFKIGADDYITKPFNSEELLYRIAAVLKGAGSNRTTSRKSLRLVVSLQLQEPHPYPRWCAGEIISKGS